METFLRGCQVDDEALRKYGERREVSTENWINKLRAIPKFYMRIGKRKRLLIGVLPGRVWRGKALTSTKSTAKDQEGLVARLGSCAGLCALGAG